MSSFFKRLGSERSAHFCAALEAAVAKKPAGPDPQARAGQKKKTAKQAAKEAAQLRAEEEEGADRDSPSQQEKKRNALRRQLAILWDYRTKVSSVLPSLVRRWGRGCGGGGGAGTPLPPGAAS